MRKTAGIDSPIKRILVAAIAALAIVAIVVSCGPPSSGEETAAECYPINLLVGVDDGIMTLRWQLQGERLRSGFNIYVSDEPLGELYPAAVLPSSVKAFNEEPFLGDTEPEDGIEFFDAEGLENGKEYFVSIRVVFPDGSLSRPSNEVAAVCFPHGETELAIRYKADNDGFSFASGEHVRADNVANDLYFYSKDGKDYLASPTRLDGFLRNTRFRGVGRHNSLIEANRAVVVLSSLPTDDRVVVRKGDWLWLNTDKSIGTTLVRVLDISGVGEERRIKLYYAHDVPFSPQVLW